MQGDIGDDLKTWSIKKLNDETVKYYLLSLKESQILQQTKVDTLDAVLAGDKNTEALDLLYTTCWPTVPLMFLVIHNSILRNMMMNWLTWAMLIGLVTGKHF